MAEQADHSQEKMLDEAVEQFLESGFRGEEPDLEEFVKQYPDLEDGIRQKVLGWQRVSSLFDRLREADQSEFQDTESAAKLVGGRIGAFEITEVVGRGGMGVVYKGRDTRLDRDVAVKAMPSHLLEDAAAHARFRREAKLLASLSHPSIGVIHDIIEQAEDRVYLVLEYVPGQTLAERIAKSRFKLEESLSIALQIAEAVSAAHEHGVVHRDLKPGNIKITPEGKVKVLDFGLAKAVGGEGLGQQSTVTEPGRVIGTPAYMSPEQARGQPTDKRSDIWSFGCVLYEMLTATVPFKGETISDTLANILQIDPEWHALPAATPVDILVLLRRCLEKDPRQRLRDIGDAAIEISEVLTQHLSAPVESHPSQRTSWKVAVLCVFLVSLAVGIIAMLIIMRGPIQSLEPRDVGRYSIPVDLVDLDLFRLGFWPVFTPDGRQLIYVAGSWWERSLFARPLDSLDAQRIGGTQDATWPQVSPDGRWLAFTARNSVWRVPFVGGTPERITDIMPDSPCLWEDNETLILSTKNPGVDGLSRFNLRTQESVPLTTLDDTPGQRVHFPLQLHPESGTLFFIAGRGIGIYNSILYAMSLKSRKLEPLRERAAGWYARSGHLIYVQRGCLMAAPFDIETLEIKGEAVNVTEDRMPTDWRLPALALSPKGTLIYAPVEAPQGSKSELVWVDLEGQEKPLGTRPMGYGKVHISGDTARPQIAAGAEGGIWIYDTGGASPIHRLTFPSEGTSGGCVIWMPDNREVLFTTFGDRREIRQKAADGSGETEVVPVNVSGWTTVLPYARSPDGKVLVARARSSEEISSRGADIVAIHLDRDGEIEPLLVSGADEHFAALSPDGKWLAYVSDEVGRDEVFVTSFPGLEGKWQVSTETEGGHEPVWAPDGKTIYYRDGSSLVAVSVETEGGFSPGPARPLFEDVYVPRPSSRNYDIHPDGKRFLMIKEVEGQEQAPITELIAVENWFDELKRLVPTEQNP